MNLPRLIQLSKIKQAPVHIRVLDDLPLQEGANSNRKYESNKNRETSRKLTRKDAKNFAFFCVSFRVLSRFLEQRGFEPLTPCVQGRCSPAELLPRERKAIAMVGPSGFEPLTPALSAQCSNQLSYGPKWSTEP